jgi:hypothetical protein
MEGIVIRSNRWLFDMIITSFWRVVFLGFADGIHKIYEFNLHSRNPQSSNIRDFNAQSKSQHNQHASNALANF